MSITAMGDDKVVAKIGTTPYTSFRNAIKGAIKGDTIILVEDDSIKIKEHKDNIDIDKKITLDLNGKTINYLPTGNYPLMRVLDSGNLTIIDRSTGTGTITSKRNDSKNISFIQVQGVCTIKGGTYSYDLLKQGCTLINVLSGTLTIENGIFSTRYGGTGGAIRNQGTTIINGGTITNNCNNKSTDLNQKHLTSTTAIYNIRGTLTINNGTINSNQYAVWVASGTAYLSSSAIYNGLIKNNDNDSTLILSDNVDFKDINSTVLDSAKTISYTRNTNNNRWGTVCLPFAPDKNKDVTYYSINSIDAANNYIDVVEVDNPEANTPYLFMLTSGNIFQATGSNTISKNETAKFVSKSGATLKGVFEKTAVFASQDDFNTSSITYNKVVDANSYYISSNTIYHINKYFNLKPYRAYFVLPTGTQSNSYQVAILDELTGVDPAENTEKSKEIIGIYSLSGQKQSQLQKGINIVRYSDGTSQTINVSSR